MSAEYDPQELLTVDELAAMWKVSKHFVYRQAADGFIPAIKFKKYLRFRRGDLETFLERQTANR